LNQARSYSKTNSSRGGVATVRIIRIRFVNEIDFVKRNTMPQILALDTTTYLTPRHTRQPSWPDKTKLVHSECSQFLLADGSVRFIGDNIDLGLYRALATIAGGEVVSEY
jgi:hypothetical protein